MVFITFCFLEFNAILCVDVNTQIYIVFTLFTLKCLQPYCLIDMCPMVLTLDAENLVENDLVLDVVNKLLKYYLNQF